MQKITTIIFDMYGVILEESKGNFILLSNDVSEWSSYITEYYQLNKYFKHKIVSGDVKCRKPEKKIYELTNLLK